MPLPQERIHTIDDIYNLPEGERAELINGQIYYMAPPSTAHQRTLSFLHLEIGNHIRNNNGSSRQRMKIVIQTTWSQIYPLFATKTN